MTLRCPRCAGELRGDTETLRCAGCGHEYPVIDGVPVLLVETTEQHRHQQRYFDAEFARRTPYVVENWRRSFLDRIFCALGIPGVDGPYLDVGVGGSGVTVVEAARLGCTAVGTDLSVEGVLAARRHVREQGVADRASVVACAAEQLPFADGSFACASAVALLEHVDDDAAAVAELHRVLRPRGLLWLTVPHAYLQMPPPVWPLYWVHDRRIGHKRHYGERRLVRLLRAAGFEHVETQFTGHPVKLLQAALTLVSTAARRPDSRLWWRLEELDRRAAARALWAVQLSAVFRR